MNRRVPRNAACKGFRRALEAFSSGVAGEAMEQTAVHSHAAQCAECAAYARRLSGLRAALRTQPTAHTPGPDFGARVRTLLPTSPTHQLGAAAGRLFPLAASTVLLLLLLNILLREPAPAWQPRVGAAPPEELLLLILETAPEPGAVARPDDSGGLRK